MSFKLSTPKPLNYNPNISKIWITTETDEEPLYLETKKCFSYRVRRNEKFNTLTMSLILDETKENLEEVISECESKLSQPLFKIFYGKNQDTITT